MVIDDLDFKGITVPPFKANAPLVIDPDAMLPFAIALKRFKMVGRWNAQVVKGNCCVKLRQSTLGSGDNIGGKPFGSLSSTYRAQPLVFRRLDHDLTVSSRDTSVKDLYLEKIQSILGQGHEAL